MSTSQFQYVFIGTEEDEEKGDKKTVRQILSQLLSNNQPANQVWSTFDFRPYCVCALGTLLFNKLFYIYSFIPIF